MQKYLATVRVTFEAEDEVEAQLIGNEMSEHLAQLLEDNDTVDVTQMIPFGTDWTTPEEMVAHMRIVRDMLIRTRIIQCFDLAKEIDKQAWILEHRAEETFDLTNYDYTAFFDLSDNILGRK